jgi:hypothetical protein
MIFRNYMKDWLRVYPLREVYRKLDKEGNYSDWRENLINLMRTEYDHPMTTALLSNKSLKSIFRYLRPRLVDLRSVSSPTSLGKWLFYNNHDFIK